MTTQFDKLTPDHLSTLLAEVLNNSIYRETARKFQDVISKTDGLSLAADIVERAFRVAIPSRSPLSSELSQLS